MSLIHTDVSIQYQFLMWYSIYHTNISKILKSHWLKLISIKMNCKIITRWSLKRKHCQTPLQGSQVSIVHVQVTADTKSKVTDHYATVSMHSTGKQCTQAPNADLTDIQHNGHLQTITTHISQNDGLSANMAHRDTAAVTGNGNKHDCAGYRTTRQKCQLISIWQSSSSSIQQCSKSVFEMELKCAAEKIQHTAVGLILTTWLLHSTHLDHLQTARCMALPVNTHWIDTHPMQIPAIND